MITNTFRKQRSRTAGFSLVEMLSVVGVIGVISAIAIPNVSNTNEASKIAATKRNAQNVVSVYQSAQSAGLIFLDPNYDLEKTIKNVVAGGLVPDGVFEGTYFGLPELSEGEIELVKQYIDFRNNGLEYFSLGVDEDTRYSIATETPAVAAAGFVTAPNFAVASPVTAFKPLVAPDEPIYSPGSVATVDPATQTFRVADYPTSTNQTTGSSKSLWSPVYYTAPSTK